MKIPHIGWYAAALAAVLIGALAFGVPASTVFLLLIALACPLMMMFMMGGHGMGGHGMNGSHGGANDAGDSRRHEDSTGR
jgi:hypothetical protein